MQSVVEIGDRIKDLLVYSLTVIILSLSFAGCTGSQSERSHADAVEKTDSIAFSFSKVDSIGIELGDSNYVFGNIIDADFMPDGRILLLDVRQDRISVFSQEGEFLTSFGREGSGPGEFMEPASVAVLSNGDICIADFILQKLVFFDQEFYYISEITGFTMQSPSSIQHGIDGSVIGFQMHSYIENDGYMVGNRIARWAHSSTPDFEYVSGYIPYNGEGALALPQFLFTVGSDDCLYVTEPSQEQYRITKLAAEGDTLFIIHEPYTQMIKTEEEISSFHFGYLLDTPGFDSHDRRQIRNSWEIDPVRNAISSIHVDGNNRLWVETGRGEQASPQFEIYNESGDHICTYVTNLPPGMRCESWRYIFGNDRVLVFDTNPEDYSHVLIYRIEERICI